MYRDPEITNFLGLNNRTDTLADDAAWFTACDNCDVDALGRVDLAKGTSKVYTGTPKYAYATKDQTRLYFTDGTSLKVYPDTTMATLTTTGRMHWCEVNNLVYYSNGVDRGVIDGDIVRAWGIDVPHPPVCVSASGHLIPGNYQVAITQLVDGRESGAMESTTFEVTDGGIELALESGTKAIYVSSNETLYFYGVTDLTTYTVDHLPRGRRLTTQFMEPPPDGGGPMMWMNGYLWIAVGNVAVPSMLHSYDLFDWSRAVQFDSDIRAMADGIIATKTQILRIDGTELADYGVPEGWPIRGGLIMTNRGLKSLSDFSDVGGYSLPIPAQADVAIVEDRGYRRAMISMRDAASAYNTED